jgi:hypothetical protein
MLKEMKVYEFNNIPLFEVAKVKITNQSPTQLH